MRMAVIFCSFLFLLTACQKEANKPVHPQAKVKVAFTDQPQSTLLYIGLENGYFLEEGIEIEPQISLFGRAALEELVAHKADIATVAETPIMFNICRGGQIQVLANILVSDANNAILARKAAGIAEPTDLKGKRIGYIPGTTSDFFLASMLTANALTEKDVEKVAFSPSEIQNAILDGKVDAVSIWNYPLAQMEERMGASAVTFHDREMYTGTFNIVALNEFTQKNPVLIQGFLRALIKAEQFVRLNPEAAQNIMAAKTRVEKRLIQQVWGDYQFRVGLDQILLITLDDEARWAISNKLVDQTQVPDFMTHIYFDGLQAVRPESIRLKH